MSVFYDWQSFANTLSTSVSKTTVSLLPHETYLNDTDVSLLRPTTYEAKHVQLTPLLKGYLYMQDPNELFSKESKDVRIDKLTLSELYSAVYVTFMKKKQNRRDVSFPLLPSLPDFDGEVPTDPEVLMRYIRGLWAIYDSEVDDPSPFQLYETLFLEFMENIASVTSLNVFDTKESLNTGELVPQCFQKHDDYIFWPASIPVFQSCTPTIQLVASMISIWMENMRCMDNLSIAIQQAERFPEAAMVISSSVVRTTFKTWKELLMDDKCALERKGDLCSFVGFVVLSRGEIQEVLAYVSILEECLTHLDNSSLSSFLLPHYEEVLRSFSLVSPTHQVTSFPINATSLETAKILPMLSEGSSVICFCVSPSGSLLAAATPSAILLFDTITGNLLLEGAVAFDLKSLWIMQFCEENRLVLTTRSGLCHVVLSTELTTLYEHNTESAAIPRRVTPESMEFLFSPRLTSGRKSSLYFTTSGKTVLNQLGGGADREVKSFVICSHINSDYVGNLVVLETNDDSFVLHIEGRIITLFQGQHKCFGICPNNAPWHFIYCRWDKGTWSLGIDNHLVDLHGVRTAQHKATSIVRATIFDGTGHVGSLVAWSSDSLDCRSIRKFSTERMVESSVKSFFHLPLDEGTGFWVKDLSTMRAVTIPESCAVWDEALCCPCVSSESCNHNVQFPEELLLRADVMISDYQTFISLPSAHKGGDGIVIVVENGSKTISYMYRCQGSQVQTLYFLSRDESYLYSFQQRFSNFAVTTISTPARRAHQLLESGIVPTDLVRGSPRWLCNEILMRICIYGVDYFKLPNEIIPLRSENMEQLCAMLHNAQRTTNALKLVAVMTLALAHFNRLVLENADSLSHIASTLNHSCKQIMEWFPGEYIRNLAAKLVRAGAVRSLTVAGKVDVLTSADDPGMSDLLDSCMNRESLHGVIMYVVNENPSNILSIAKGLLRRCKIEEKKRFLGRSVVVPNMLWFSLISVQILNAHKHDTIISSMLELFLQHTHDLFSSLSLEDDSDVAMQETMIHTGLFSMLVSVAALCPAAVTPNIEMSLLQLFDKLAYGAKEKPFVVSFETKQACDVVPTGDDSSFKFVLDCTKATSVSIAMKMSASDVTVITSSSSASKPNQLILNNKTPFVKVPASSLVLYGTGETSLTIVCNYDLCVGTSWKVIIRDAVVNLLLSAARHLTSTPKPCDVFLAPLLRHGLSTKTLLAHGIDVPDRVTESTFAVDILNDVGEGKKFVDDVWENMRGCVTQPMRPAIRALLALLIHSGMDPQLAIDEFRLRWFSGEWGSKLQGSGKDAARQSLVRLTKWITSSVYYQRDVSPLFTRRLSNRRRSIMEGSLGPLRTVNELRTSTNTRRSTVKGVMQSQETLDQVRALLTKDITPETLEKILVVRTFSALNTVRGLKLLLTILSKLEKCGVKTLHGILQVLWLLCGEGNGKHMIESFVGAGTKLEMCIRVAFHSVLEACSSFLISENTEKDLHLIAPLTSPAKNGASIMLLLAIMCHPWDTVDCEFFKCSGSEDGMTGILKHLADMMSALSHCTPLKNPSFRSQAQSDSTGSTTEQGSWNELIGILEYVSVNCLLPNGFSVVIPDVNVSFTEGFIGFEKTTSGSLILRADEAWPLPQFVPSFCGIPRVFYYEVTLSSQCRTFALCLSRCREGMDNDVDVVYFYENSGATHDVSCPPFKQGDTVGCGVVATTRRIFFTLNGFLIAYMGTVHEKTKELFPTIRIDNDSGVNFLVNFGYAAFSYDFRMQHPVFFFMRSPSWYGVASTAEIVLHYIAARVCVMQESCRPSAKDFLCKCCEIVCTGIKNVALSLIEASVGDFDEAQICDQRTAMLSIAVSSLKIFIATLRHILQMTKLYPLPDRIGEMAFKAVTVLMKMSVRSIQISTISFLPEVLSHVSHVHNIDASKELVSTLFEHAKASVESSREITFIPYWQRCDNRCMAIRNLQEAFMQRDAQRSVVLGGLLPRTGMVSFTVRIFRKEMSKGHSLKGGYYVGIAVPNLTPLTPTSSSQGWKAARPPTVWALHDITPQLSHATNPSVKSNIFYRTFGSGDAIRVVLDRDKQTLSYYRDDEFLNTLFTDIPSNIDLVPFVQLYNDDASVTISPGKMTAPISSSKLIGAASVDVLRCMLTLKPFENMVADGICEELDGAAFPSVTLALFKGTPDPRVLQLCCRNGERALVTARRLLKNSVKLSVGNITYYENVSNLRTVFFSGMNGTFDLPDGASSMSGVERCVSSLVSALCRLIVPLVSTQSLCFVETRQRQNILEEEINEWDNLLQSSRLDEFMFIHRASQRISLLEPTRVAFNYTFSALLSHPGFVFSSHYCGRLATVPSGATNTTAPFIAIAEPAVPLTGRFSLRCQLIRGHTGQILGGGYYFGLCTSSFDWKRRDLGVGNPEVWAIHDMDDTPWRLRHLYSGTRFNPVDEPNCIIVSGDIVRLEVDRDEGTMNAYRKGKNEDEVFMGLVFDSIPKDTKLYPFVHLYNTDAAAVILPLELDKYAIRTTVQQPHFVFQNANAKKKCDGCVIQHLETRLASRVWYKCNECVDYNLCQSCFALCIHFHHSFTEMGADPLVYATSPPKLISVGMNVVIPGTSALYLRNWGCRMIEKQMNCVAESRRNNAMVMWGIVFKTVATFTVTVNTLNGEPLYHESPMFIGIGERAAIYSLSSESLREKCISGETGLVSFCSDLSLTRKINSASIPSCSFKRGSTITIEVDITTGEAYIRCDWLTLSKYHFQISSTADAVNLIGFVLFGQENVTVSVSSEMNQTFFATVDEVNGKFFRVSCKGQMRYVRPEHCRLPLYLCGGQPRIGTFGYVFVNKELLQAKVVGIDKKDVLYQLPLDNTTYRVPLMEFLVGKGEAIAEERLLRCDALETGVTMNTGFVISRLLLILSYLCENETLSAYVLLHSSTLLNMLGSMAAMEISNDTHTEFIQEIRAAVDMTCNCLRELTRNTRVEGFKPSPAIGSKRFVAKQGMLMCAVGGSHQGKIFMVSSEETSDVFKGMEIDIFSKKNTKLSNTLVTLNTTDCIPVKQCYGRPWWTLKNGLPCNMLEHTLRVTNPKQEAVDATLEGIWQGEISVPRGGIGFIWIKLGADTLGAAEVSFFSLTKEVKCKCYVFGEYTRYSRAVRLCLFNGTDSKCCNIFLRLKNKNGKSLSFDAAVEQVELALSSDKSSTFLVVMDGVIDWEGQRVAGEWKPRNDRAGTFVVSLLRQIGFATLTTDLAHIEPLPECKDPLVLPPQQLDMASTMHRLIVLLSRHLYLFILDKGVVVSRDVFKSIIHYHAHPLTEQIVLACTDTEKLLHTMYETLCLIFDPSAKPWDFASLSLLITKTLLLRPDMLVDFPTVFWDLFHAVVAATHSCGAAYRHNPLKNIISLVEQHCHGFEDIYKQLLPSLLVWVDRNVSNFLTSFENRKDVSAGVELVMSLGKSFCGDIVSNIPLAPLQCLVDMANSFREGIPLPRAVDIVEETVTRNDVSTVEAICVFGEFTDGLLKVGKVMSSCPTCTHGKYYYEVILPERLSAPFVAGWGTEEHIEVPSIHVGSDSCSFAFTGTELTVKNKKEEYKLVQELIPGSVVGCLLDMDKKMAAWSVNGVFGPFVPIPIDHGESGLYAFISTGYCRGMRVTFCSLGFGYVPDGYSDISGRYTRFHVFEDNEGPSCSVLPVQPITFYEQLASYLSDVESGTSVSGADSHCMSVSLVSSLLLDRTEPESLARYPLLVNSTSAERKQHLRVISVAESCMVTARRFIDLDTDVVEGRLTSAFLLLKPIVRRSFGKKLLVSIPPVEKNNNPASITVRITELYSTLPRTPEVALQHSVLSQIYKQIGSFTDKQFCQSPLFKVHLYIAGSGHVPQDYGGPYRQLWTFLCEELMAHPDKCYPHTDYHRNPLCRYLNNSRRVALVPDSSANSTYDLILLNFLGKIMGHAAVTNTPLALDFSRFVWKYLVENPLTVRDYYKHVDSVVEKSMEDFDFLVNGMAEEIIPNLSARLGSLNIEDASDEVFAVECRRLAEDCLVHSMDLQLNAIREGLWSVLPKRVVRCLSWQELERMICGDSNLTPQLMRQSIDVQLGGSREQAFWRIMDEFDLEQRASFLCFACGQKRLPLIRTIRVIENTESTEHLPRAQSCTSLVTVPAYETYEVFKEKLLLAITHEMEMELA